MLDERPTAVAHQLEGDLGRPVQPGGPYEGRRRCQPPHGQPGSCGVCEQNGRHHIQNSMCAGVGLMEDGVRKEGVGEGTLGAS